jgi:predicted GIY-YIG superfamily endonuclease
MSRIWKMTEEEKKIVAYAEKHNKEFYYVGHYITEDGKYVLKPGTTNDLRRRRSEHNSDYRKTPNFRIKEGTYFVYDWFIPLSKYTTLRIEDLVKDEFKAKGFGFYQNNDRFIFDEKPSEITIKIRKEYHIAL